MIPREKIRATFTELAGRKPASLHEGNIIGAAGSSWLLEALSLLEATLGVSHATTRSMRDSLDYLFANVAHGPEYRRHDARARAAEGAFMAAKQVVDGDAINGLVDLVRAATEADLLNQADGLLHQHAVAAAAVVAGGALETHLWGLVERLELQWKGDRGIATYNNAIATYRKKNPDRGPYAAATGDLISGWAKMRNEAAHEPLTFAKNYSEDRVRQMIDGIRSLIS